MPADLDPRSLDSEVRGQLRSLSKTVADKVAARLVATGELVDVDPERALEHALVARRMAPRIGAVREAAGLAAYHAGQWHTAIAELRAYHRMVGGQAHLAVLADCERALGRPEKAIDMYRSADREQLRPDEAVELLIVAAGARADLGQKDAAVAMLQVRELTADEPWTARLRYAYADALLGVGRREEAREWFARAAEIDEDALTDAAERLLDMDGVVLDDAVEDDTEDADAEEVRAEGPAATEDLHEADEDFEEEGDFEEEEDLEDADLEDDDFDDQDDEDEEDLDDDDEDLEDDDEDLEDDDEDLEDDDEDLEDDFEVVDDEDVEEDEDGDVDEVDKIKAEADEDEKPDS